MSRTATQLGEAVNAHYTRALNLRNGYTNITSRNLDLNRLDPDFAASITRISGNLRTQLEEALEAAVLLITETADLDLLALSPIGEVAGHLADTCDFIDVHLTDEEEILDILERTSTKLALIYLDHSN